MFLVLVMQDILDQKTREGIKFACTDMWAGYLKLRKTRASGDLDILDRFHVAKKFAVSLRGKRDIELNVAKNDPQSQATVSWFAIEVKSTRACH